MALNDYTTIVLGVRYYPTFVSDPDEAFDDLYASINFQQRTARMYGHTYRTPRLEAWFGSKPYTFGGSTMAGAAMPPEVLALRIRIECVVSEATFDGCLANLYRDGSDSVAWHSDDEPEMGDPIVASISLGAPRDFLLRRKPAYKPSPVARCTRDSEAYKITLAHGSLLVMDRGVQGEWQHSLPKRQRCSEPRINLTYRSTT